MNIELTSGESSRLRDALHECLEVARRYRSDIADEDSIVLIQDLHAIAELLGIAIDPPAGEGSECGAAPTRAE